jgi:hypothetical protein
MPSATVNSVSDLLVTTKSREVQRGMLAESHGDRAAATRHFLAAAHLELVLSDDYAAAGLGDLALRSQIGAASCFWRAGEIARAKSLFSDLAAANGDGAQAASEALADLEAQHPSAA